MKCEAKFFQPCAKDAVMIFAGEALCREHASQRLNWFTADARKDFEQRLADLQKLYADAKTAGIPQEEESDL